VKRIAETLGAGRSNLVERAAYRRPRSRQCQAGYRLMKKHGLLLARHTGRRVPRAHDGTNVISRSNER
jgi:hypothetical protein